LIPILPPLHLSYSALDIRREPLGGTLRLDPEDGIRLCVPDRGEGTVRPLPDGASGSSLALAFPEICVMPPQRGCDITMPTAQSVLVFGLDMHYCDELAMKQHGTRCRIPDCLVTMDPFVRRMGTTLAVALRRDQAPQEEAMKGFARDLAAHVVNAYAKPSAGRMRRGLSPERLARVKKAIEAGLGTSLSTATLAGVAHLSEFHFCRMFRYSTGYSPHAYVTMMRMDRARELLESGGLTIREIAEAVGYKTQAHFTCVFHAYCGSTPAAYRRLKLEGPATLASPRGLPPGETQPGLQELR